MQILQVKLKAYFEWLVDRGSKGHIFWVKWKITCSFESSMRRLITRMDKEGGVCKVGGPLWLVF